MNCPPAAEHTQAFPSNMKYQPTPSEPPLDRPVTRPTLFETLNALPSSLPNPLTGCLPPIGSQDMTPSATVVGCDVFPMDPSDLATMHRAPHHFVIVARACGPLTDPTVCEEQTPLQSGNANPPQNDHPQAPSTNQICQTILSGLPSDQQEDQPTLNGPSTARPSSLPSPLTDQPPTADSDHGWTTSEVNPVEEVCCDHSTAEPVVGGAGKRIP